MSQHTELNSVGLCGWHHLFSQHYATINLNLLWKSLYQCLTVAFTFSVWIQYQKGFNLSTASQLQRQLRNQFSSVAQSCLTLCNFMDCSTPGFPVHHQLPGAYSKSCPSSWWCHPTITSSIVPLHLPPSIFPSIRVFSNESSYSHQVAKYWEFQLQHQSFQWIFRTDFL